MNYVGMWESVKVEDYFWILQIWEKWAVAAAIGRSTQDSRSFFLRS